MTERHERYDEDPGRGDKISDKDSFAGRSYKVDKGSIFLYTGIKFNVIAR